MAAWLELEVGGLGSCWSISSCPSIPEARGPRFTTSVEARDAGRGPSWGCPEGFVEAVTMAHGAGKISLSSSIIGVHAGGDRGDGIFSNISGSKMGPS